MVTRAAVTALVIALASGGCQSHRSEAVAGDGSARTDPMVRGEDARAGSGSGSTPADPGAHAGSGSAGTADDSAAGSDKPVSDAIADLGAISAWQSVIDRAQYLKRRGQTGTVYGRIGPPILMSRVPLGSPPDAAPEQVPSQYVWLVDDTEGNGTLGIRVALGGRPAKLGDRVAFGGAWTLDESRQWYWDVDALHPLPPVVVPAPTPGEAKDPPAAVPNHVIVNGGLPGGAHTITVARDNDAIYFMIVGPPPVRDGDGWLVANELGDPAFARLVLPGERPSYGGQDMRAADERWELRKGQTYWVRIGRIRPAAGPPNPPGDPPKPVGMTARTAPVRVL